MGAGCPARASARRVRSTGPPWPDERMAASLRPSGADAPDESAAPWCARRRLGGPRDCCSAALCLTLSTRVAIRSPRLARRASRARQVPGPQGLAPGRGETAHKAHGGAVCAALSRSRRAGDRAPISVRDWGGTSQPGCVSFGHFSCAYKKSDPGALQVRPELWATGRSSPRMRCRLASTTFGGTEATPGKHQQALVWHAPHGDPRDPSSIGADTDAL